MRIGIYDPYLDDIGGGEKYMMTIAACLSQGNIVDVFWDKTSDINTLVKRFSLDLSRVHTVPNIFSSRFSTFQRLIKTHNYDAIILLSDGSIPWVSAKKLFIHIQQPLSVMQISSVFDKAKLTRVNMFFCNSLYTKSFIDKKFAHKTKVIYPPILLPGEKLYKSKTISKKENIILHVGRFRVKNVSNGDYKKQSVLIEVFKKMVHEGLKDWEFILAVSIQEEDIIAFHNMKESAKGYPIRFLVNQTNEELWKIYAKAKIYWHASGFNEDLEKHPEFAEHFGISTVEAMGAGAVPVVINAGGQKEIVQNEKNGFLWDTLVQLQYQTLTLIENASILKKLSDSAQVRAKEFSGDRFCKEIHALIT